VRALGKASFEKLALRGLLKAHHLLGLALAHRLTAMRASDDPLEAATAEIHTASLLASVLRDALALLGDRFGKLPERQRPHYTPTQRFRVLRLKHLLALSQEDAARLFRVSVTTIARWETRANPESQVIGSTVTPVPPVRRYSDTVHHLTQTLSGLGFGGYDLVARHLARGGWRIAASTVRRYVREPRMPDPHVPVPQTPKRAVVARFAHHLWHIDSTLLPGLFGSTARSLAVVFDSFSRMPLVAVIRSQPFDAAAMGALVESAFALLGTPRHLIADQGGEFVATVFRERIATWGVALRFCAADHHRANSRLERFWLTLKQQLRVSRVAVPPSATDVQRALLYYAFHRPHQGLGGATPAEVYFGHPPAHRSAVQPPRGKHGGPPVSSPVIVDFLEGDERFPILRAA
jgi:transposase InsO family protein